ncbi:MAG: hypothetical protein MR971_06980 [Bacteroidales bacterium]|nr:hypothetical protein [Bacteroidales bacterium]
MKKSTFILSLLLAFLGVTATAQTYAFKKFAALGTTAVSSLSELEDGGTYAFYNTNQRKYIKLADCSTLKLNNDSQLSADDETDGLAVFTLHKVAGQENTFTIETAYSGIYMKPVVNGPGYAQATTEPASFVFSTTNSAGQDAADNRFFIKNSGDNMWFDMQANQFVGWQGTGDNARYEIYNVTLSEESVVDYNVTINLKDQEGNLIMTTDSVKRAGTTVSFNPTLSYYYTAFTLTNTSNVVAAGNTEFNYTVQKGTIPVTFSTAGNNTWYALQIMNQGTRTVKAYYDSDDTAWHVYTAPSAFNATDLGNYDGFNNAIWAFVESGTGVKLYNKGTDKYLKWTSGFATLEAAANATTFYITENSQEGVTNCFGLWTGNGTQYLNASETKGGVANARLGVWNSAGAATDNGSRFRFWSVDEANSSLVEVGKSCFANTEITPNEANANYVTAGLAADIANVKTAAAAASVTNLDALDAIVAKLNYPGVDIDANAYYRIGNVNLSDAQKKYVSSENIFVGIDGALATAYYANTSMDRIVRRVPATGNFTSMLWKLEKKADGTYFVRNANTGCNLSDYVGTGIDMPVDVASGGSYTFKAVPTATFNGNDGKTMLQILVNGHRINAFQGNSNNIISDYDGNHDNDKGNYWQLEKVTSVPVSISDALYASVGFPFAVQVPAGSGVKAYYATAAGDGELTLSEIADGIIPAYTGAILAATAATDVNLAIVTTDKSLDNKLVAATAKRTGFAENANYMLGVDSEVKFLQATITTVPANKAYLPATNVTNSNYALAFNFGGESTGIANTLKDNEEVQYFDLNGRVVLYPSNGVFITNTGKKVFIK